MQIEVVHFIARLATVQQKTHTRTISQKINIRD